MRDSKKEARLRGVDAGAPARRDPPPATERGHSIPVRTLGADGIRLGLVLLLLLLLLRVRELVGDLVASAAGLSLLRRHGCLTTLFAMCKQQAACCEVTADARARPRPPAGA